MKVLFNFNFNILCKYRRQTPEQLSKEDLSVIDSLKLILTLGLQMLQKVSRSLAASLLSMLRQDVNLKFQ